jgi:hypothetical protein
MLTRREFLVVSAAITASTPSGASAQQRASGHKPPILFILADDLGWGDLSCYGRPDYKTPVLDNLAARGVRLLQAYANSSTCSPTRVALITGRYHCQAAHRLAFHPSTQRSPACSGRPDIGRPSSASGIWGFHQRSDR